MSLEAGSVSVFHSTLNTVMSSGVIAMRSFVVHNKPGITLKSVSGFSFVTSFSGAAPIEGGGRYRGLRRAAVCVIEVSIDGAGGFFGQECMAMVASMECAMNKRTSIMPSVEARSSSGVHGYNIESNDPDGTPLTDSEPALRWRHITMVLNMLREESDTISSPYHINRNECREINHRGYSGRNATIEILDRPSRSTIVLSWRDPTGCRYGYQTWYKTVARRSGICAMSGASIRRGDMIFRPRLKGQRPANASAMVLAKHIDSLGIKT